ncbi:hypothetical protein BA895_06315 [Humibacillus sp. DSM 29435]|nr:hypothetical protein BA895_06315 [Humibacillus sp. DSM 29435]
MPVSSSGFVDEAPGPDPNRGVGQGGRRRAWRLGGFFVTVLLALLVFGGWAWTSRAHADDLVAFEALSAGIDIMDRSLTPQRHSEIPPCRDREAGLVTRTYPDTDGPAAAEIVGYLLQHGWQEVDPTPPALGALTKTVAGHELSVSIIATSRSALPLSLTASSAASTVGCFLR